MIKFIESPVTPKTYRTIKYGNLLSDTIQGEVYYSDGEWHGWYMNHSDSRLTKFRFGFKSRAAAARWVNRHLRLAGVVA